MELRFEIDDTIMSSLKNSLSLKQGKDVINIALTILDWAVKERENARIILSANEDGTNPKTLVLPSLELAGHKAKRGI